jgi:antagonist of KipI
VSAIEVQSPGLLTTIQDLGREGFGPLGVSPSGAADPLSLRIGNRLVSNPQGAAGLEMTLLGGTFFFLQSATIALTGSDFGATLDGISLDLWKSTPVRAGQTLRMGPTLSGARCYLSVHGGIAVKAFLGSASTHLLSGLGGYHGRALRKGDVLQLGHQITLLCKKTVAAPALAQLSPRKILRVTPGPQSDSFPESSLRAFYECTYRVAEESNRMGLRLQGSSIARESSDEMLTEGVSLGAVQITASGLPIILFVEQQTTGGYPIIANVISADLHSLGQLRPRDEIRLQQVDWESARSLLLEQEQLLASDGLILG